MTKVTIPREVADAIETLRSGAACIPVRDNAYICELAMHTGGGVPVATEVLRQIPFDMLMRALLDGYERELTEEEKREQAIADVYQEVVFGPLRYATSEEQDAYADGILFALQAFGIDIPGVNTPHETEELANV